jgi:hypothetical protein
MNPMSIMPAGLHAPSYLFGAPYLPIKQLGYCLLLLVSRIIKSHGAREIFQEQRSRSWRLHESSLL